MDGVLKFSNIAGPGIGLEVSLSLGREPGRATLLGIEPGKKVLREREDVLRALAQWRQPKGDYVEPGKYTPPDPACRNFLAQRSVRRRHHSYVDLARS